MGAMAVAGSRVHRDSASEMAEVSVSTSCGDAMACRMRHERRGIWIKECITSVDANINDDGGGVKEDSLDGELNVRYKGVS